VVEDEKPVYEKLAELENEIKGLKLMVAELVGKPKEVVSLEGMLTGVLIGEGDFEEAKRALFKLGA
jgi:hypothetical protein